MEKLDSAKAVLDWLQALLLDLVEGIKGTFAWWSHRKDALEDLAE